MITKKLRTNGVLALAMAMGFSCGGGDNSGDPMLSGVFVDSPVAGLSFDTPSVSGVTDADGVFQYREGEIIVFSIGQLTLPLVVASEIVTPLDMVATDDVTDPSVVNIARILQSLDEDSDPSNGILIAESVAEQFSETEIFDGQDNSAVAGVVDQAFSGEREPVSESAAVAHFVDTLSSMSDSTVELSQLQYLVKDSETFSGENLAIGEDNFTLILDGDTQSGLAANKHGVYQLTGETQTWFVSVTTIDENKVACVAAYPKAVTDCGDDLYRVFDEEQQAMLYNVETADVVDVVEAAVLDIGAAKEGGSQSEVIESQPPQQPIENSEIETAPVDAKLEELFEPCGFGTEDFDGDGYGWQNNQTCLIASVSVDVPVDATPEVVEAIKEPVVVAPEVVEVVAEPVVVIPEVVEVIAEPVVVIPEVVEVIAEPVVVTPAVAEIVAEPVVVIPEVVEVIAEPVVVIPAVAEIVAEPVVVIPEVVEVIAEPVVVAPEVVEVVAEPVVVTPAVVEVIAEPVVVTPDVAEVIAEPVVVTPDVAEVIAEPVVVKPDVVEIVSEPVVVTPEVVEVIAEPVVVIPDVVEVIAEPVVVTPDVIEVVAEPIVITPEVVEVIAEPVVVTPVPNFLPSDITDLILLTGQANAVGQLTAFDATLDASNERVFAFTEEGLWQVADLHQNWDGSTPGNFSNDVAGREPYNNLVYQVGKALAEKSDRVVGIVMITAPGEGISHWDYDGAFYQEVRTVAASALAALPQKSKIDALLWMHGETDWLYEGTADPGATGYGSIESDFYRNYYPTKLSQLMSNLRSEWWFGSKAKFICGETKKANLNQHLMALNADGDNRTGCAKASDLPTRANDPYGNHFSAEGFRILGDRMADIYLDPDTGNLATSAVTIEENSLGFCGFNGVVKTVHQGYNGTGYINSDSNVGSTIVYEVQAPASSQYTIEVRYANGYEAPFNAKLLVNDNINSAVPYLFTSTGSWTSWSGETQGVSLVAGSNRIELIAETGNGLPNIDQIVINGATVAPSCANY